MIDSIYKLSDKELKILINSKDADTIQEIIDTLAKIATTSLRLANNIRILADEKQKGIK